MARCYLRGKLVDDIDFDSTCPFTMTGGNGDIYRGSLILDVDPDGSARRFCYVALKSIRCGTDDVDNRLAKIAGEAAVWKKLRHPHILRFLGILTDVGGNYLVAPFAPHGSLPQYLNQNPEADRPMFLAQTAAGIAYLHDQGIVHGDVKGANILVFDGPSARICDFGLAKLADPSPGTTQNTVGSLSWMSPEQLSGKTRTQESDVYAFGMTVYETLSGSIPFAGLTFIAVYKAVYSNKERPPMQPQSSTTGVSYALLWALAARCWSQLAAERPSMGEVFDAIKASIANYVERGDDDLPIMSTSLPAKKRKRTDGVPGLSGTNESDAESGDILPLAVNATKDVDVDRPAKRAKVNAPVDGALTNGPVDPGTNLVGQRVIMTPKAVDVNPTERYPSASLPARPDIFFGREEYINTVVERLCCLGSGGEGNPPASNPPRLAILGPGGIGKTTVALAAVADNRVKVAYEDRIHWVPCDETTTAELLVELVARSMGVPATKSGDRKGDIIDFLRSSTKPRLLLLDNFETPWDIPTKQTEINNFLYDIASVYPLAILLTMRSDAPPPTRIRWTSPTLPPLSSLTPEAARDMYLDIHEDARNDPQLADLLHELAHMPLAVKLMATRGSLGEGPSTLLGLWKDKRIRAKLLHQGDDRITSVTVSVELSINSHQMRRNPDALSLISILAELPGGARHDFIQSIAPSIVDCGGALGTLRRAALIQIDPSTRHIHLLSPVRSLVLESHPAQVELRNTVHNAYYSLLHEYKSTPGYKLFLKAVPLLTSEAVNIESILMDTMNSDPSDACIDAAYTYSEFQYFTIPRTQIIEKAVGVAQSGDENYDAKLLPRGLALMALIYRVMNRYSDAVDAALKALPMFQRIGDQLGEANCLDSLGDAYRMMGRYSDAVDAAQKALPMFQRIGSQLGEANCFKSLGDAYRMMGRYSDAVDAAQKALPMFQRIGSQLGEANCFKSLGDAYRMMGRYSDAVDAALKALPMYQRIGSQLGEAGCFKSLGDAYRMMGRYSDAVDAALKALPMYQRIGSQLGEANCLDSLGDAYRMMGRYSDAVDAAQKALPMYQRIGDQLGEANCFKSLGDAYRMMGRCPDAVDAVQKALPMYQQIGDQLGEANCLRSLARTYDRLNRAEDGAHVAQEAMDIFLRIGRDSDVRNCQVLLSELAAESD